MIIPPLDAIAIILALLIIGALTRRPTTIMLSAILYSIATDNNWGAIAVQAFILIILIYVLASGIFRAVTD